MYGCHPIKQGKSYRLRQWRGGCWPVLKPSTPAEPVFLEHWIAGWFLPPHGGFPRVVDRLPYSPHLDGLELFPFLRAYTSTGEAIYRHTLLDESEAEWCATPAEAWGAFRDFLDINKLSLDDAPDIHRRRYADGVKIQCA